MRPLLYGAPIGDEIVASFDSLSGAQTVEDQLSLASPEPTVSLLPLHTYLVTLELWPRIDNGPQPQGFLPFRLADGTGQTIGRGAVWLDGTANLGEIRATGRASGLITSTVGTWTIRVYAGPATPDDGSMWLDTYINVTVVDLGVVGAADAVVVT